MLRRGLRSGRPGGLLERRRRLFPARLSQRDEAEVERRARVGGPEVGHAAELPEGLVEHGGLVERDAEVPVLVHPALVDLGRGRRRRAGPVREPRRDEAIERLPDLELHQAALLDDRLDVAAAVEERHQPLLLDRQLDRGLADV